MMRRASAFLACLLASSLVFLVASGPAAAADLPGDCGVSLTNIELLMGWEDDLWDPITWRSPNAFPGGFSSQNSSHITIDTDEGADWADFNVIAPLVSTGLEDAYIVTALALSDYFHAIRFDWAIDWERWDADEDLRFEIWGERWGSHSGEPEDYQLLDSSHLYPWMSSGGVTMWTNDGAAYIELHLIAAPAAVPEPSCLLLLATCLTGLAVIRRWRQS